MACSIAGSPRVLLALALGLSSSSVGSAEEAREAAPWIVPPLDGPNVTTVSVERDGARRLLAYGARVLLKPDGELSVAAELLPQGRDFQALQLPDRLGGGLVLAVVNSDQSSLWKASTWGGRLTPLADLDFEIQRLAPGLDRLYVQAKRGGDWVALDPESGKGLDRGSLPAAPAYGDMAFLDPWFGAVELPVRGVVVTFDAGNTWHPLLASGPLSVESGEIRFRRGVARYGLGPDGLLRRVDPADRARASASGDPGRVLPVGPLGATPLQHAVLRGTPDGGDSALVVSRGALGRVRLSDGRVLGIHPGVVPASSECVALPVGSSTGFACGELHSRTTVYALKPPLSLEKIEEFDAPRRISPSDNGGLVIGGGCASADSEAKEPGLHCVRTPDGEHFEVRVHEWRSGARVVALRGQSAAVVVPPSPGRRGFLRLVGMAGQDATTPLDLAKLDERVRGFLARGLWLDGFTQAEDDSLQGWVALGDDLLGVRIEKDAKVRVGSVRAGLKQTLLAGPRALRVGSTGLAEQSVDGGFEWHDVELPLGIELDAEKLAVGKSGLEQGCSAVGCAFLGFLRIGWGTGAALPVAQRPEPTRFLQPGGSRWQLRCWATGQVSTPPLAQIPRRRVGSAMALEAQAPWLPFLERPAPALRGPSMAFDTGADAGSVPMRAYVWAALGADFAQSGQFQLFALDDYAIPDGIWSTRPTPGLWRDAHVAAQDFGYEGSAPSIWRLTLDAGGRAGVLSVTSRGTTELLSIAEDQPASSLGNATLNGVAVVSSVARLQGAYYVASHPDPRRVRIHALEGGAARLVGEYSDVARNRSASPVLVRGTGDDALGLWVNDGGWYVFPFDPRTGAVEPAVELSPAVLAVPPPACDADEEGFLLEGSIGLEPSLDLTGAAEEIAARRVRGRFIVSEGRVCVVGLVAQSAGSVSPTLRKETPTRGELPNVPLTLVDATERGRRWGFLCGG